MEIYLSLLAVSSVIVTFLLLDLLLNSQKRIIKQRIKIIKFLENEKAGFGLENLLPEGSLELVEAFLPKSLRQETLVIRLEQADIDMQPHKIQLTRALSTLFMIVLSIGMFVNSRELSDLLLWFLISLTVFISPEIFLRGKKLQRQEQIMKELPDFMDLMRVYVSSGLSIYQSIKEVQSISGPSIKKILIKLSAEMEIFPQEKALQNFALRTDLSEVKNFVLTLEQGLAAGVPLKEVFHQQSQQIREIRRLAFKKRLKKKPTYLALVGGLLFINIFIIIGIPAVVILISMRGIN